MTHDLSPRSALDYVRSGQSTFFRLPTADFDRSGPEAYRGARAVLLGVPWDGGTTYQPGARLGPYHLRRVSALVQGHHPTHHLDVFRALPTIDGGNVVTPPFDDALMRTVVEATVDDVASTEAIPALAGGDHSITLPALRALARRHGPLAVVHVDAHLDVSGPEVWGEAHHHGTPFRHALEEGLIDEGQLHQVGIRATWGGVDDDAILRRARATRVTPDQLADLGARTVGETIRARVGARPTYLSIDVDALDPAFAPGTGTPVPGGLSTRELLAFVRALAGVRLVGLDVVEVCPALDHADVTAHVGAALLFEGLALAAWLRR
jgi:agmatinase